MEAKITGAVAATLSGTRAVTVCQLNEGYGQQDTESSYAREFHASILPTCIYQLLLSLGFMCTVQFMCSRLPLKCFSGSRNSCSMGPLILWEVLGWLGFPSTCLIRSGNFGPNLNGIDWFHCYVMTVLSSASFLKCWKYGWLMDMHILCALRINGCMHQ